MAHPSGLHFYVTSSETFPDHLQLTYHLPHHLFIYSPPIFNLIVLFIHLNTIRLPFQKVWDLSNLVHTIFVTLMTHKEFSLYVLIGWMNTSLHSDRNIQGGRRGFLEIHPSFFHPTGSPFCIQQNSFLKKEKKKLFFMRTCPLGANFSNSPEILQTF